LIYERKKEIDEISEFLKALFMFSGSEIFGDFQDNLSGICDQK
jgi:hypothetical protein